MWKTSEVSTTVHLYKKASNTSFDYQFLHALTKREMIEVSGLLGTGDDSLFKINWQLTIIQLSSFVIHGLTNIKIKLFEMSQQNSKHLRTHFEEDISFIDGRAISDFATNVFAVVATSSFGISTTIVNYLNPADFNRYPDYFVVYFLHFVVPFLISGTISMMYYVRHSPLKKTLYREAKSQFQWLN